jgi:hypothetical protein
MSASIKSKVKRSCSCDLHRNSPRMRRTCSRRFEMHVCLSVFCRYNSRRNAGTEGGHRVQISSAGSTQGRRRWLRRTRGPCREARQKLADSKRLRNGSNCHFRLNAVRPGWTSTT